MKETFVIGSHHFGVQIVVKLLALALTNLVLDLANLATNWAKQSHGHPSHQPDLT